MPAGGKVATYSSPSMMGSGLTSDHCGEVNEGVVFSLYPVAATGQVMRTWLPPVLMVTRGDPPPAPLTPSAPMPWTRRPVGFASVPALETWKSIVFSPAFHPVVRRNETRLAKSPV